SILVLDNCHIHHNKALVQLVQSAGKSERCCALILYLPAYSPDLNPINESFSTHMLYAFSCFLCHLSMAPDPIQTLLEACGCIMADMCRAWFANSGYCIW
ncbi:hypothetical protein L208DRAFT_1262848, partial [Tricholoma matsutake]